ncbi:hypothetical protein K6W16_10550 [Burkholderia dolosa]|jgi:hypothetical protein|uniref:Lipoprotein n=1 Tax=Burkholderia dolosa TaxID=152500 RepID=A0A892IA52_9BURK|nr:MULTISPECIES: hypothetical protein [Burkholderia]AKE03017.1 hypothetical protein XM57_08710 [Burkholderia cepacia]AJY14522.1 hypothetical protein AK34_693 [Burkholderia dolosa AU0158]AYZ97769.1 hypothetical protein EGY28_22665 [Burkholderia dolosa]EAY68223.1 hypothetical protein BDAG_00931 [Burkholderia dolosa AU0158]ETP64842.1 hypothetical protein BDSB_05330 [Burkholderia dolosa PC543]
MLKLIAAAGVATLLAGCVVGPDAGYGYGQTYYSDPGYAYGPAYAPAPVYGTINIWGGGGGRDWGHRDYHRWDRDRGDHRGWGRGGGWRGDWNGGGGGRGHGDGGRHGH